MGPPSSSLMAAAISSQSGKDTRSPIPDRRISNGRFNSGSRISIGCDQFAEEVEVCLDLDRAIELEGGISSILPVPFEKGTITIEFQYAIHDLRNVAWFCNKTAVVVPSNVCNLRFFLNGSHVGPSRCQDAI